MRGAARAGVGWGMWAGCAWCLAGGYHPAVPWYPGTHPRCTHHAPVLDCSRRLARQLGLGLHQSRGARRQRLQAEGAPNGSGRGRKQRKAAARLVQGQPRSARSQGCGWPFLARTSCSAASSRRWCSAPRAASWRSCSSSRRPQRSSLCSCGAERRRQGGRGGEAAAACWLSAVEPHAPSNPVPHHLWPQPTCSCSSSSALVRCSASASAA